MTFKYTCLTVFIIFLGSLSQAQIKKGSILLGGIVRYENHKSDDKSLAENKIKEKQFEIGPTIGIAIRDNFVAGLELGYSNRKNEHESNYFQNDHKLDGYYANAVIRKYWNITSKFYAFAHGKAGYGRAKGKIEDKAGKDLLITKTWQVNASLTPGIAYSVSRKVQLESTFLPLFNINYGKEETEIPATDTKTKKNNFAVSSSLANGQQFSLGIRFLLEK
jgi:hypothetical protein